MGSLAGLRLHVLVVPFPAQGHLNPMLQFAKRLLSKKLTVTFVTTEAIREGMLQAKDAPLPGKSMDPSLEVQIETISDGLPLDFDRSKDLHLTMDMLWKMGAKSLTNLIQRLYGDGNIISCIVYDSILHWVPEVAKKFNIPLAFFWTQSAAVYSIYYRFSRRGLTCNGRDGSTEVIEIPGFPLLKMSDLPTFLHPSNVYVFLLRFFMDQFKPFSEATWILGNSFQELESDEINSMKSIAPIRTVGPLLPSAFLDGRINPGETECGAHLWKTAQCMDWLNSKEPASVVYVSFGSFVVLPKEQIHEIAFGLKASGFSFIWVIRPPANSKGGMTMNNEESLPEGFFNEISSQGLVVPWCSQLQVLSHASVGAFMTHCGWNSTLESLSLGVPMLAVPQWSDQTTNSVYITEKWKTGLRLKKPSADGSVVGKEEVERCIRIIMDSQLGTELRNNALRWKTLSREAMLDGGSSDQNIQEFVDDIVGRASSRPSISI